MQTIQLWDLPLRLFHWLLVAGVIAAYVTATIGGLLLNLHATIGIFILSLIVFRILWGILGPTPARFVSFFPTPKRVGIFITSSREHPGHTPLGALSIFVMLCLILSQAGLGLFAMNDEIEFHGPFYDSVSTEWSERASRWHRQLFDYLAIFIGLHLIAIAYYLFYKRNNILYPMLNGKKSVADDAFVPSIDGGGKRRFFIAFIISASVYGCIESAPLLIKIINKPQENPHEKQTMDLQPHDHIQYEHTGHVKPG